MIVVSDTSPINYLIRIQQIELLKNIYRKVWMSQGVHKELLAAGAPPAVRQWAEQLPDWVEVVALPVPFVPIPRLDVGETEAILLAEAMHADLLLIDEAPGRRECVRRGLTPVGTVGVLLEAHRRRHVDLHAALESLESVGFRLSDELKQQIFDLI